MTKIISMYGGPGTGKSTTSAGLFHLMKNSGYSVELVTEYAKELVWENANCKLGDQLYIFAKQYRRITRLLGKVDYIITDAPVLNSLIYGQTTKIFRDLVVEQYQSCDNIDIFLHRVKPYVEAGRQQTESESHALDRKIQGMVNVLSKNYHEVCADSHAPEKIFSIIKRTQ